MNMKIKPLIIISLAIIVPIVVNSIRHRSDGKFEMRDTHATGFTSIHKVHVARDGTKYQLVEAEGKWGVKTLDSSEYIYVKDTCEEAKKTLKFLLDYEYDPAFSRQQRAIQALPWKVSDCNEEPLK